MTMYQNNIISFFYTHGIFDSCVYSYVLLIVSNALAHTRTRTLTFTRITFKPTPGAENAPIDIRCSCSGFVQSAICVDSRLSKQKNIAMLAHACRLLCLLSDSNFCFSVASFGTIYPCKVSMLTFSFCLPACEHNSI